MRCPGRRRPSVVPTLASPLQARRSRCGFRPGRPARATRLPAGTCASQSSRRSPTGPHWLPRPSRARPPRPLVPCRPVQTFALSLDEQRRRPTVLPTAASSTQRIRSRYGFPSGRPACATSPSTRMCAPPTGRPGRPDRGRGRRNRSCRVGRSQHPSPRQTRQLARIVSGVSDGIGVQRLSRDVSRLLWAGARQLTSQ